MTEKTRHSDEGGGGSYWRFMAMVSTSTVTVRDRASGIRGDKL